MFGQTFVVAALRQAEAYRTSYERVLSACYIIFRVGIPALPIWRIRHPGLT